MTVSMKTIQAWYTNGYAMAMEAIEAGDSLSLTEPLAWAESQLSRYGFLEEERAVLLEEFKTGFIDALDEPRGYYGGVPHIYF